MLPAGEAPDVTMFAERIRIVELTGRPAIASVAALVGTMFVATTLVTPLYVIYEQKFHFSRLTLTLIYAVYAVGNLAALLFFGGWSDRIGRRPVALAAVAVAIVGTLLFLFAAGTPWLFWARALSGFAIALAAGTATAWTSELDPERDKARASLIVTSSNFVGLAIGSLLAGLLAQYAPRPLELPFAVYLALLLVISLLVARTRETVDVSRRGLAPLSFRPRLGVPPQIRAAFIAPAVSDFGAMALVGFYAALIPGILAENLRQTSHAVAGLVVFELALVVALTILATRHVRSRTAMMARLALMPPGLALLVVAQGLSSMTILLAGTVVSGIATALGYRGSLHLVNEIAPDDRRAEVASSYVVCGFMGNALPVIGVGVLSSLANPMAASMVFALTVGGFAIAALVVATRYLPRPATDGVSDSRERKGSRRSDPRA
jgi:MFS family permease